MNGLNPYNCALPGHAFVGHERMRRQLLRGFRNGNSYAILGGRRAGKTSLLVQIERDAQRADLAPFRALPRFLDIQELGELTPSLLFEQFYNLAIRDVEAEPWTPGEPGREYQHFLGRLDAAKPALN